MECYGCTDRLVEYSDYQQHLKTHHKLKFVLSQPHAEVLGVYNVDTSRGRFDYEIEIDRSLFGICYEYFFYSGQLRLAPILVQRV